MKKNQVFFKKFIKKEKTTKMDVISKKRSRNFSIAKESFMNEEKSKNRRYSLKNTEMNAQLKKGNLKLKN
jgi:hypothetical protein